MEINKYQQAYQNVQAELPVDNEDIVVLRELVEKSILKKVEVIEVLSSLYGLSYVDAYEFYYPTSYEFYCPTCRKIIAIAWDPKAISSGKFPHYCPSCGQKIKMGR